MPYAFPFRNLAPTLLTVCLIAASVANAQAQSAQPGVAFVSDLNGVVTVERGDSDDQEAAAINAPLMVGDYLMTGGDGRAEVQFDYGHVLRVGPDAQLRFTELDPGADIAQLAAGSVGLAVLHGSAKDTQVETPSVTVQPAAAGYYRVAVEADGTTEITVRHGNAAILLPQGTRYLHSGSTMDVWGPASSPSFRYVRPIGNDSFDSWNNDRDLAFERSRAYNYAPDSIPGAYALDSYGEWVSSPDGNEWIPSGVAADWSPYSAGQWTDEPYYGWTWVDNDPWGYAPFHYGRWYRDTHRNRWAWTPGPHGEYGQSWSPALVAFIGFGGVGVSIALSNDIGWVPLAPNEQPHPWWGDGARAYQAQNQPNFRSAYANARWSNAVRAVPRAQFATGRYQRTAPVAAASFSHAVVMRAAIPVVPEAQGLRFTQRAATPVHARPTAQAFHAFRTAPRAPQTFAQQRTQAATVAQHATFGAPQRAPVTAHAAAVHRAPVAAQGQHPAQAPHAAAATHHAPVAAQAQHPAQAPHAAAATHRAPVAAQAQHPAQAPHAAAATHRAPVAAQAQHPAQAPHAAAATHHAPVAAQAQRPAQAPRAAPAYQAPRPQAAAPQAAHPAAPAAPVHQLPHPAAPVYQAPRPAAPARQAPRPAAPAYQAPRAAAPAYQAPRAAAPAFQAPRAQAPAPAVQAPRAAPPAFQQRAPAAAPPRAPAAAAPRAPAAAGPRAAPKPSP